MKITLGPASLYFLATKRSNVNGWVAFLFWLILITCKGFPDSSVVKNLPNNAGDTGDVGSIPGSGRSSGVGNVNLLQDSCLKNSVDKGAWWATVHGVTKSQAWLSNWPHTHTSFVKGSRSIYIYVTLMFSSDLLFVVQATIFFFKQVPTGNLAKWWEHKIV